jgi:hypothetical protein
MYGDIPEQPYDVSIKYVNTVSGEEITENYLLYNTVTIKSDSVFSIKIHRTYIFKEFNTSPDGSGESFLPGAEVYLTTEGENVLYAIYEIVNSATLDILVSKHFKEFDTTDEVFTISGYLSDSTGSSLLEELGIICFRYNGNITEIGTLQLVLDMTTLNENVEYYIKIFENKGESMVLYDTNYYIVKFVINGVTPTILDISKYRNDGNKIESFEFDDRLEFTNILTMEADRLPDMGGNGVNEFRAVGLLVIAIGFLFFVFERKRRNKVL